MVDHPHKKKKGLGLHKPGDGHDPNEPKHRASIKAQAGKPLRRGTPKSKLDRFERVSDSTSPSPDKSKGDRNIFKDSGQRKRMKAAQKSLRSGK